VALSVVEAEYIAIESCSAQIIWLLTLWQVYQFVTISKMEVQVSFSQGICVCLSNCNYLLILAMVTTLMVNLIHKINMKNY